MTDVGHGTFPVSGTSHIRSSNSDRDSLITGLQNDFTQILRIARGTLLTMAAHIEENKVDQWRDEAAWKNHARDGVMGEYGQYRSNPL